MSDVLAIFGPADSDPELLEAITVFRPDRVTVLIEDAEAGLVGEESEAGDAVRDRLADLMAAVEGRTGAAVVGVTGDRSQLAGWRFDRELAPRVPIAA
ncbi:MAG TPA: hypothetical protein VGH45_11595 [Solirubrobacteraceae bacterium]|jgi:hypothetical protein